MDTRTEWQRRLGVGERQPTDGRNGPTRKRPVVTEEGPHRGKVGGFQVDHKSGRVDAVVKPAAVSVKASMRQE